jgi:HAE1 family hydrophobic/amphiphilic exporter-1
MNFGSAIIHSFTIKAAFAAVLFCGAIGANGQDPSQTPFPTATPVQPVPGATVPPAVLPSDPPPVAPDFSAPVRPMPGSERVGVDVTNQLSLTLEQAIELALKNSNDIDVSRNDVQIAEFNLRAARGVYDPLMENQTYYESLTTPTASLIGGAVNGAVTLKRILSTSGVSGFTPKWGGSYSARFDSSRTSTSNTNATLNPQYPTNLTFSYTQPLLRNFGIDNNRRQIEIAKQNLSLSDAQFRQRAIEVISQVEQAYWNLAFALRNLSVQIDAVKQARTQLESNQRQVDKGVLAPIEVVAATAQVTNLEQLVYAAQETVTRSENTLKTLMLPDRTSGEWSRPLTPVSPISLEAPKTGLATAIADALKNRQEIAEFTTRAALNKIDQDYFRNQAKPQIDLVGTYTMQGLAGAVTPNGVGRVPENLIGGYTTSLGNLLAQDYPSYRIGVAISLPWGNRVAKANLGRSLVEGERIGNQRAAIEQTIESEVRNSLQALRSAEARLASALAARQAAEQLAQSEERQFRAGTSTFYLVQQRQTELLTARSRELQAQTDLNRAISEFQRATGTTLTANNVTVSDSKSLTLTNRGSKLAVNAPFFVREK